MTVTSGLLIVGLFIGALALADEQGIPPASNQSPFQAKGVAHSGTIRLNGPVDKVFPLFGPVRESEWAPGWTVDVVHPVGSEVAEGMVFKTQGEQGETLWVITRYDPGQHIVAYANVTPGYMVNRILITCAPASGQTDATISYWHVALGERGNEFVRQMGAPAYAAKMEHWRQAINHRLATGTTIPEHNP